MCKKQTPVSHNSTESEIISLDAKLRLDGIPALDLWDLIVTVLHGNTYQNNQTRRRLVYEPTWIVQYLTHIKNESNLME